MKILKWRFLYILPSIFKNESLNFHHLTISSAFILHVHICPDSNIYCRLSIKNMIQPLIHPHFSFIKLHIEIFFFLVYYYLELFRKLVYFPSWCVLSDIKTAQGHINKDKDRIFKTGVSAEQAARDSYAVKVHWAGEKFDSLYESAHFLSCWFRYETRWRSKFLMLFFIISTVSCRQLITCLFLTYTNEKRSQLTNEFLTLI